MIANKILTLEHEAIVFPVPTDKCGAGVVQFINGGSGTLAVEALLWGSEWITLGVVDVEDETGTPATSIATAGGYRYNTYGYEKVRVRKSDVGGASIEVNVSWGRI